MIASFVGKIFVLRCSATKTTKVLPPKSTTIHVYNVYNVSFEAPPWLKLDFSIFKTRLNLFDFDLVPVCSEQGFGIHYLLCIQSRTYMQVYIVFSLMSGLSARSFFSQVCGDYLFSGSSDHSLHVYKFTTGELVIRLPSYHERAINSIAVSAYEVWGCLCIYSVKRKRLKWIFM